MITSIHTILNANVKRPHFASQDRSTPTGFASTLNMIGNAPNVPGTAGMTPAEKIRSAWLAQHGLSQQDLDKMSPAQVEQLENVIKAGH